MVQPSKRLQQPPAQLVGRIDRSCEIEEKFCKRLQSTLAPSCISSRRPGQARGIEEERLSMGWDEGLIRDVTGAGDVAARIARAAEAIAARRLPCGQAH
jgi:hypothetical protein